MLNITRFHHTKQNNENNSINIRHCLIFQAKKTEKLIQMKILEDDIPELEESVLVYLTDPLGGARIATGSPDGGKKVEIALHIDSCLAV